MGCGGEEIAQSATRHAQDQPEERRPISGVMKGAVERGWPALLCTGFRPLFPIGIAYAGLAV
jgi:hypothetical protein